MELKFKVTPIRFNSELYIADVRAEMHRVFRRAAQRFLVAAVPRVRYFTGFTRGAFRNLEDVAGQVSETARGPRIEGRRKGSKNNNVNSGARGYYYYPPGGGRVLRTPEAGREFSTKGENNIFKIAQGRVNFYFMFKVDIRYYSESAWGQSSWKAGEKAFIDFVERNTRLPDPGDPRYS